MFAGKYRCPCLDEVGDSASFCFKLSAPTYNASKSLVDETDPVRVNAMALQIVSKRRMIKQTMILVNKRGL